MARAAGWEESSLHAGRFQLLAIHPVPQPVEEIAVFIEGDGLAWLDASTPSTDPTPVAPIALQLALVDPHAIAVYLARPCQFSVTHLADQCVQSDWTSARYSEEVIAATDQAVGELKLRFSAKRVKLVGYSGGGAVAALVAARRTDVSQLVTVAAVLDHQRWTQELGLSPLSKSLNPVDQWTALRTVPQVHFVGGNDSVTGAAALNGYLDLFAPHQQPTLVVLPQFTHQCCWIEAWKVLSPL
jgi:dienelactone hydrolase